MPRKCSICTHEQVSQINTLIARAVSFRSISGQFGMSKTSVHRHAENCLELDVAVIHQENKTKQAINVYEEFCEQLEFAKSLRTAAMEYLSDANDPLKMSLTPKAHEIEVTYFDHNDMEMVNNVSRPKKKTAQLSTILEAIYSDARLEPDKFQVKTIDIRKFALDAINTTDTCIDKFAKIEGLYTKDKINPSDALTVARKIIEDAVANGMERTEAVKKASERYGILEESLLNG